MSYKYSEIPKGKEVVWITLVRPYKGNHSYSHSFPPDLRVGDKTWVLKSNWDNNSLWFHPEKNRYSINLDREYFELVPNDIYSEPIYDIY